MMSEERTQHLVVTMAVTISLVTFLRDALLTFTFITSFHHLLLLPTDKQHLLFLLTDKR